MADSEKERKEQLKKAEKIIKSAKDWSDYWLGIDMMIASIGFDTTEEYDELEDRLDKKYRHTLAG